MSVVFYLEMGVGCLEFRESSVAGAVLIIGGINVEPCPSVSRRVKIRTTVKDSPLASLKIRVERQTCSFREVPILDFIVP